MPIEYRIDHDQRVVLARALGILTDNDVFGYQREVWSRADVAGYNELIDMTAVEKIALPSGDRVSKLAPLSAAMDPPTPPSKFAIVAPDDFAFGLGRMYEAYRCMNEQSTKEVAVFREMASAWRWLGVEGTPQVRFQV